MTDGELARVTIHDVARLAGVSTASVSRALSGSRPVSPSVARSVRAAASRLGYEPDAVGRSLRRQETLTVGLVVPNITNAFFPALVQAVEDALQLEGYGLLLADASDDPVRELASVRRLLARRVDALFITPCHRYRSRAAIIESARQVTTVQLDRYASSRADYVGMDHDLAVRDVLEHLAAVGKKHPAMIGSDPAMSTAWERQRSYIRRVGSIDAAGVDRVLVGTFTFDWGRTAAAKVLQAWPEVDALLCANDLIALGATEELRRRGVKVPEQVAVVGFDDTLFATLKEPSLTSVRQPLTEMAREAVALIPARSRAQRTGFVRTLLPATLTIRNSTQRP
jgi:LacI family transcriptional regulator